MTDQPIPPEIPIAQAGSVARPGKSPLGALRLGNFRRLWIGMSISSLGDWVGLYALLSLTNKLSDGNTLAIAGLMISRVLPALLIGPLAGVALDRWNRRTAMVVCDICRAALIAIIPFAPTLPVLFAVAFALEVLAMVWMPAKDSLIPMLVPKRWLLSANSLALLTTYGVFPLGAWIYGGLVGLSDVFAGGLPGAQLPQENLALWVDSASFLVSALVVSRIRMPSLPRQKRALRFGVVKQEIAEGLRYLVQRGEIARLVRGIAFALVGGAVVFSLGSPFVSDVLGGGSKGFALVIAFLGTGMGVGVLLIQPLSARVPSAWIFALGIIGGGVALVGMAAVTEIRVVTGLAGILGAFAGMATTTSFAMLQERVSDELRGRTFAAVQMVIRLSLFVSLIAFPVLNELLKALLQSAPDAIRLSLALGGFVGIAAGTLTARDVYRGRIQ